MGTEELAHDLDTVATGAAIAAIPNKLAADGGHGG